MRGTARSAWQRQAPRRQVPQRGIGLAELLVATAIGAVLMLMGALMLVSANTAWTAQADGAALDDGGRFALDIIARATRQAAFVDWENATAADAVNAPPQILGRDALALPRTSHGIDGATGDAVNGSDILALRFSGAHGGGALDCAGFGVDAGEDGWSIFHVGRNAAGEGELRCKYRGGGGWGSDAIVDGVDTFQVLYGIDTDVPGDGVPNEFVSASVIELRDGALLLNGPDAAARQRDLQRRTHWKRVAAVRVALLLHGASAAASREPLVFDVFGAPYSERFADGDDGVRIDEAPMVAALRLRERRLFASTILLRNVSPGEP
ncbi:PilW family protein [Massilia sp. DWR3-1-1]|uniref:PilW family protein n=1 Tax=Massilia sp. DWR3-1-1 TaxID=2804559 RepID=UPI003CF456FB